MEHLAFVSIGSNMGSTMLNCKNAVERLSQNCSLAIQKVSSFYKTAPVGKIDQDWFVNCVVSLRTSLKPEILLDLFLEIEKGMGRIRGERWGERVIDLDLLMYDMRKMDTSRLTLPHPRMYERAFVLIPMAEIAPDLMLPEVQKSIVEILPSVKAQKVYLSGEDNV